MYGGHPLANCGATRYISAHTMMSLQNKHIMLGVSGSIAAYKALSLLRLCTEAGAQVWPILTANACRFVTPMSFSALSGRRTIVDMWSDAEAGQISHVELAHQADVLVIAPATASMIARLAQGHVDDPLTAVALSTRAPCVIAPAMEDGMWHHPATQANIATLRQRGVWVISPEQGALASGRIGAGRMAEPAAILETILRVLTPQDLRGERMLITAGPTREAMDPARFISNRSTGKMGYALAQAALRRGAEVHLVTGPTHCDVPMGAECTRIDTTAELLDACMRILPSVTTVIMAAAPADYQPVTYSEHKIKKSTLVNADAPPLAQHSLALRNTPDVLATLSKAHVPSPTSPRPMFVGFAAETHDVLQHAQQKLQTKNVDMIVANDISRSDQGFAAETNAVTLVCRDGTTYPIPLMHKQDIAHQILNHVQQHRRLPQKK